MSWPLYMAHGVTPEMLISKTYGSRKKREETDDEDRSVAESSNRFHRQTWDTYQGS